MSVYRHYDKPQLDAQYDLRQRHPDFQAQFDWWERESARVQAALPNRTDVPFGQTPGQTLDVFPAPHPGAPVLVFIHGGYWRSLDKKFFRFLAEPVVSAGAALAVTNYDLAPQVGMDEIVRQVRRAVVWCYRNAGDINGDPGRLYISGHSAGGHLAAMMAVVDWTTGAGLPADVVKGICTVSGLFDLEPVRQSFLNEDIRLDTDTARRNSPIHHLPRRGVSLVAAVGGDETDEFLRHNAEFAAAWHARGFPCQKLVLPGRNHFTVMQELARSDAPLTQALLAQMGLPAA